MTSTDNVALAVETAGPPDTPTVLCIHGYPDNRSVWDAVATDLVTAGLRVVRYDVRGAGDSDAPAGRAAYRLDQLTDDLLTVLDAVNPQCPVHVVGHDWGAIQTWHALGSGRLAGRALSFTSISGPSLDHATRWMRSQLRLDHEARRRVLRQVVKSTYLVLFVPPGLPEFLWRTRIMDRLLSGRLRLPERSAAGQRRLSDKINGLQLYRANIARRRRPALQQTTIPVQVLAPIRDRYVSVELQTEAPAPWVAELRTEVFDDGHWIIVRHPHLVADRIAALIREVERRRDVS